MGEKKHGEIIDSLERASSSLGATSKFILPSAGGICI